MILANFLGPSMMWIIVEAVSCHFPLQCQH